MTQPNKKSRIEGIEQVMSIVDDHKENLNSSEYKTVCDVLMENMKPPDRQWYQLKYIVVKPYAESEDESENDEEVISHCIEHCRTYYVRMTKDQFLQIDQAKPAPARQVWNQIREDTDLPDLNAVRYVGYENTRVQDCILVQSIVLVDE